MKRHGFHGGRATHGSMFHRAPGGIGASAYPSRVIKGTKMAGHMGNERKTIKNLRVVAVDTDNNLLLIHGAVPGPNGSYVLIKKAQ
jgi:large subunit ribosomal protein L3